MCDCCEVDVGGGRGGKASCSKSGHALLDSVFRTTLECSRYCYADKYIIHTYHTYSSYVVGLDVLDSLLEHEPRLTTL